METLSTQNEYNDNQKNANMQLKKDF